MNDEPQVEYATVRDAGDEWHLECRMSDGQKGAFVRVDREFEALADRLAAFLSTGFGWEDVDLLMGPLWTVSDEEFLRKIGHIRNISNRIAALLPPRTP